MMLRTDTIARRKVTFNTIKPQLMPYGKIPVLRALLMYHKNHKKDYINTKMQNLYAARNRFGQQFLMDLFIITELYISHWPIIDIPMCRDDIVRVLNNNPDHRLLYEEGKFFRN